MGPGLNITESGPSANACGVNKVIVIDWGVMNFTARFILQLFSGRFRSMNDISIVGRYMLEALHNENRTSDGHWGHVRFTPESGHSAGLLRMSALCQKRTLARRHSITSSALASSVVGMSRPSAFAVLRLMTSSNLVGCMTGKSAGLAPFKMRPA